MEKAIVTAAQEGNAFGENNYVCRLKENLGKKRGVKRTNAGKKGTKAPLIAGSYIQAPMPNYLPASRAYTAEKENG